jgi:ubiquinol-cytochrome c reductase cytochrome c1 subunit
MLKTIALGTVVALGLSSGAALAAGGAHAEIIDFDFPHEGPFGSYDTQQLQRGLAIYTQVCAACHGLQHVAYRNLSDPGGPMLPEDQMRAYAEQFEVWDPTLFDGEGDFRPATPADHFGRSNLSNAPDLSLMAKARKGFEGPYGTGISQLINGMGGPEYIASLLVGYHEPPSCAPEDMEGSYNAAFVNGAYPEECKDEHGKHLYPGSWIAMGQPLYGDDIEFANGEVNTLESGAEDVAAFLMWTAEPKLNARKQAGVTGVIFLTVLAVLLYLTNKRLWAGVKHARKD